MIIEIHEYMKHFPYKIHNSSKFFVYFRVFLLEDRLTTEFNFYIQSDIKIK